MSNAKNGIGFIGCGKMAQAIINGIVKSPVAKKFKLSAFDTDQKTLTSACKKFRIKKEKSNIDVMKNNRIIILAVKPQGMAEALGMVKGALKPGHLIISIAAGVSIAKIQALLEKIVPVVRVMPNTPALVGEGAAGYAFSSQVSAGDKKTAVQILSTFCRVMENVPEAEINTVTALSGSGPAYVFYFAEAMLEAANRMGFDMKKARNLVAQTFTGAAELFRQSKDSPETLRLNVTSKGGTTERAVSVMDKNNIKENFISAVIAAKEKADELGK